jgi:hypothetical protein
VLALWVGGIVIFTVVVTPRIFSHYDRDMAGEVVGVLFPGYFSYNLIVSIAAVTLLFIMWKWNPAHALRLSLALGIVAVGVNLVIMLKIYPAILEIKRQVPSFVTTPPDAPLRVAFSRLHAVSAVLNLALVVIGAVMLYLSRGLNR